MKCFFYFKEKGKGRTERKPSSTPPASRPVSNSGAPPATSSSNSSGSDSSKQANRSSPASSSSPRRIPSLYEERAHSMRVFDLGELRTATNNFSRLLKIGEGGFGSVYRGHIRGSNGQGDRIAVAIKKLNQHSLQGHKQWLAEVQLLGVVEHPNLVKLIGYCAVDGERGIQRLLVYEFMPNRSLEDHLFSRISPVLPWDKRLKICMGVAEGLRYLHEGLEVQVIYRDFKASNILLDGDFKPKLSDFGLAREGPSEGNTHVSTAVVGTYGYAAPDYIETGHLTIKSDVWSFGVVLYEILTGRRSLDRNRPRNEHKLLDWVKQFPVESRRFPMIMDPRLGKQYSLAAAQSIAKLANTCLSKNPKDRPSMSKVIEILKKAIQMSETVGSPEPPIKEQPATVSNGEKRAEQINGSESSKQRILQMARLRQSANVDGRRRVVVQQANRL